MSKLFITTYIFIWKSINYNVDFFNLFRHLCISRIEKNKTKINIKIKNMEYFFHF